MYRIGKSIGKKYRTDEISRKQDMRKMFRKNRGVSTNTSNDI